MGWIYKILGQYDLALKSLEESLDIQVGLLQDNSHQRPEILNNLGEVHFALGNYNRALEYYQEVAKHPSWNPNIYILALNNTGRVYAAQNNDEQALKSYQEALSLAKKLNDRPLERNILSNIGDLFRENDRPETAIAFYKTAVNLNESIRQELTRLSLEEQQAYVQTVAPLYRNLADLLLSRGRVLEAQRVLELLKVQELRNYTRSPNIGTSENQLAFNETHAEILDEHGTLIAFGQTVLECEQNDCDNLSQMRDRLDRLSTQFNQNITQIESEIAARRRQDRGFLDPEDLGRAAQEIVEAEPGTIVIYPFVLPDKIWLLWAAPGGVFNTIEVPVSETELAATVLKFRQSLQDPYSNLAQLQQTSQKLYNWLIKPLAAELEANEIQHLVFSLDRATRYIPLSALFDGDRYLVERYQISTILSADLTDVRDRLPPAQETNILAMGLSEAVAGFNPLPNVTTEIDAVVRTDANDPQGLTSSRRFT